jgi:energy-coupling factor transport system permease protein
VQGLLDYHPGDSLLHRLNPVTKLVVSSCAVLAAFVFPTAHGPLVLLVIVVALAVTAGIARPLAKTAGALLTPLAVALFVVHGLFFPDRATPLVTAGPLIIWEEGIAYAALVLSRLATLVLAFLTTILTTSPRRLMVALTDKGLSPKLAYVFLATLEFVPEMQQRARAVLDAQQARGLDVKANLWRRLKAFVALMGPLIGGALIATETRALALEARGFNRPGPRTYLVEVADPPAERVARWLAVGGLAVVVAWRLLR